MVEIVKDVDCKEALALFNQRPITETNYCAGQWKSISGEWEGACTAEVTF